MISRAILGGQGVESITKHLEHYEGVTHRRAKNIARDQTHKTYEALSMRRAKTLGFTHFEWIHSGGSQQPRSYHMREHPSGLNHGIFRIDHPPVIDPNTGTRGFPGDLPNCHCTMRPVLKFEDEEK